MDNPKMTNSGNVGKQKKVWQLLNLVFGLPLMYIGVAILVGAFFLDKVSNALLVTAIVLEIVGAVAHFRRSLP